MARTFPPGDERATWGIRPRICVDLQTQAEAAIRAAICEVEKAGAHPMLTGAVVLLGQALDKLGEYVDEVDGAATALTEKVRAQHMLDSEALPPDVRISALQDTVHVDAGPSRPARSKRDVP